MSHGGPTGSTSSVYRLAAAYYTSRGIAVLDVDYGGSTGYGTEYRRRLNGKWGIVDVDDCVNGARYLVKAGRVDGERLAIKGGSAGGYTTLSALAFRDVFQAGASHFGIGDLEALDQDTHKFESHYNHSLIAPLPIPKELYLERSPIHHVDQLNCALILFQGEQHGFRKAENIIRSLEAELYFFGKVFGFEPADKIEPVKIENLK
jgi:dipeptidyl aminopeptidase/acylaminoacyl peptidase